MLIFRSIIFYIGYVVAVTIVCVASLLFGWMLPFKKRFIVPAVLTRFVLFWLKLSCNISMQIDGLEHIRTALQAHRACVFAGNHQSPWETLVIQSFAMPMVSVLKYELIWIPIFGWALALLKPVTLIRKNKTQALRQVIAQGSVHLSQGHNLLIFPEGTRRYAPELGPFTRTATKLAHENKCPIIPFAHNAGSRWPAHQITKYPGTIRVIFGPHIQPMPDSKLATQQLRTWIEATCSSIH